MTFLQPWILWGLPLALIPVIIHLINRLRHRPQPWAAMRFLIAATRQSTSRARLRQFLILAMRVLAVLGLVLFLSRPLGGGWLGWALSPAPDAILVLLDRSPSMEQAANTGATLSRRQRALDLIAQGLAPFDGRSRLVLIDSVDREPTPFASGRELAASPLVGPSDAPADLPAMLRSAYQWIVNNNPGAVEIWVASDLQESGWLPTDETWKSLTGQLAALPQPARVRLLSTASPIPNTGLVLADFQRVEKSSVSSLNLALDIFTTSKQASEIRVTIDLQGSATEIPVQLPGEVTRWRHTIPLPAAAKEGWGSVRIPSDSNPADNIVYFAYGPPVSPTVLAVGESPTLMRLPALAAGALKDGAYLPARQIGLADFPSQDLGAVTTILWQGPVPDPETANRLEQFLLDGGTILAFPSTEGSGRGQPVAGLSWGDLQTADSGQTFTLANWKEDDGPLARSEEGISLPLQLLEITQRRRILGDGSVLAGFADDASFLVRQIHGRGRLYLCGTLAAAGWSNFGDGQVLVPMVRRILAEGARKSALARLAAVGAESRSPEAWRAWKPIETPSLDPRAQAGLFRSEDSLLALNIPASEVQSPLLDPEAAARLFGPLGARSFQDNARDTDGLQGEIWRFFLIAMMLFLLVEGWLILPLASPLSKTSPAKGGAA